MYNNERINELTEFARDFRKRLNLQYSKFDNKIFNSQTNSPNKNYLLTDFSTTTSSKLSNKNKKKEEFNENLFESKISWKPNYIKGKYFGNFKKLNDTYEMSNWDKYRINLVKRSFEKEKDILKLNKKNKPFVCKKLVGEYLDKNPYGYNPNFTNENFSDLGKKILDNFIKENEKIMNKREMEAEKTYKEIHSKHSHSRNPNWSSENNWKYTNKLHDYFDKLKVDDVYAFDNIYNKGKKKIFTQEDPWRPNKKRGTYFDRDIHFLESHNNEYVPTAI